MIELLILWIIGFTMLAVAAYYDHKNVPTGQNLF